YFKSNMMDDYSSTSEILVYTHIVYTIWEWTESQITKLRHSWNSIEEEYNSYDVRITFLPEKQAFEIKANSNDIMDEVRRDFFKLLQKMSNDAKAVFTVLPREVERVSEKTDNVLVGRPPPLDDDDDPFPFLQERDESIKRKYYFSTAIGNVHRLLRWKRENYEPDAWKEICDSCNIIGYLIPQEEDINEAVKRLKTLEELYKRESYKIEIPLVHHHNINLQFKLCFLKHEDHIYFGKAFRIDAKDPYIIVTAIRDPSGQKWVTPNYEVNGRAFVLSEKSNRGKAIELQGQNSNDFEAHSWPAIELPKTKTPWADLPNVAASSSNPQASTLDSESLERSSSTEEHKKTHQDVKKLQMAKARRNRATKYANVDENSSGSTSSAWYTRPEPLEERDYDDNSTIVPIKSMNLEKGPNSTQDRNIRKPGIIVRDYNFAQIKQALVPGFEYVRAHKGEVRFTGSLGKVYFTNVNQDITKNLWGFSDLKDIIVKEHRVKPFHQNIASDLMDFGPKLIDDEMFEGMLWEDYSFFEIVADARNSVSSEYSRVYMHVDCAVSLKKVAFPWDHNVDIYWTILERNFDFTMSLKTRRLIRPDVKPFSAFIKTTAISPDQNSITCENINDYLYVKSITYKTVSRCKLHFPFIAEVTRVEQRPLEDQKEFNKIKANCEGSKVHWTVEFINYKHETFFKENETLPVGKVATWEVHEALGEESQVKFLVEHVKTMLKAAERCSKLVYELHENYFF
ncbi:12127_t:CDS:10, partial [Acaulospora morrowiae]